MALSLEAVSSRKGDDALEEKIKTLDELARQARETLDELEEKLEATGCDERRQTRVNPRDTVM